MAVNVDRPRTVSRSKQPLWCSIIIDERNDDTSVSELLFDIGEVLTIGKWNACDTVSWSKDLSNLILLPLEGCEYSFSGCTRITGPPLVICALAIIAPILAA